MVKEDRLTRGDVNQDYLSKDKRFENLTGRVFGDLVILGAYKKVGKTLRWVAECSCGNIVSTTRTKLKSRGKTSCVDCSEKRLKAKHFTPLNVKKDDLNERRKDITIVNTRGETWADYWEVVCNVCNIQYTKRYRDLISGVKGCKCRNLSRKSLDEKEVTIKEYCNKYGFEFKGWGLDSRIKADLYCPKHESSSTSYYGNIQKGKVFCKGCRDELYRPYNLKTRDEFIKDARHVHGRSFNYDKVDYVNTETKVELFCNKCNTTIWQKPSGHLSGRGCNNCKKTGYKPNEPCFLYVMQLVGMGTIHYKIGITSSIKKRLYNLNLNSWFEITPIRVHKLNFGWEAHKIESVVKSKIPCGSVDRKYQPEGFTEVFDEDYIDIVSNIIDEELLLYRGLV